LYERDRPHFIEEVYHKHRFNSALGYPNLLQLRINPSGRLPNQGVINVHIRGALH
jgi:hypothetical protein